VYRTVTFNHGCPGEWRTSEDGVEVVASESRELPEAVARSVAHRVAFIGSVVQHSYYGWAFDAKLDGCAFYTVFNIAPEECWLTVCLRWYWLKRLFGKKPRATFDRYCGIVGDALQAIPTVSDIAWEEYRS